MVKISLIYVLVAVAIVIVLFVATKNVRTIMRGEVVEEERIINLDDYEKATFSGGCFWCSESDFERHEGVVEVISGYSGGEEVDPSYSEVSSGQTGHKEGVQVYYNPKKISYETLLDIFWKHIDPTDDGGQFVDRGFQYTTAIFYHNASQKKMAEKSKEELDKSGKFDKPIVTPIIKFKNFYEAEEYHQDYHKKSSLKYNFYRKGSGRDQFVCNVWECDDGKVKIDKMESKEGMEDFVKPSDAELKKTLTSIQYKITQKDGTERPFTNEYWDNKEEGIYVDIVSGEVLYSSKDKFKSGTGWPSFTKPLVESNIVRKEDNRFFMKRIEIRSKNADSHLGHLFNDGPADNGGLRYCMNSAALRFVPKANMEKEGYGEFLSSV